MKIKGRDLIVLAGVIGTCAAQVFWPAKTTASTAANYQVDQSSGTYDWIVYVDIDTLPSYFNFSSASLNPIDRLLVTFQETAAGEMLRGVAAASSPVINYEEYWFHNGKPVSLFRQQAAPMPSSEQGAICVRYDGQDSNNTYANSAADCLMRLLIDSQGNRSNIAAVLVPTASLDGIARGLTNYGFQEVVDNSLQANSLTSLKLVSYPDQDERVFYFAPPGNTN